MSINRYIKTNRINSQNDLEINGDIKVYFTGPIIGASNLQHEKYTGYKCGENIGFCDKNRLCNTQGYCIDYQNSQNISMDKESRMRLCNDNSDNNCITSYVCDSNNQNCIGLYK